jgi:thiol-disulfide isomerase/thioredoxin
VSGRAALVAVCTLAIAPLGCDRAEQGTGAPSSRSEAVTAARDMPAASASQTASAPSAHAPAPATPRNLCESDLAQPGRRLSKATFSAVAASGAIAPASKLPIGTGHWTWINFFASWCAPCKEEMPRLRDFQQKLAPSLEVAFVSLDDDERLLKRFLDAQAGSGVRGALWLPPGKPREGWLSTFALKDPPELPAHVLVDPAGKVRCVLGGAIDDADFPRIAAIVRR